MKLGQKMFLNTLGTAILLFAQWLISVLIVRIGGYADAGIFSLAMSVSNIFSFLANYGIRNYQVSDTQKQFRQQEYLHARAITSVVSFLFSAAYLSIANYTVEEKIAIFIYLVYSNINVISDTLLGTLQVYGRLEYSGYSNIIRGCFCFVGFVATYIVSNNIVISLVAMSFLSLLATGLYDVPRYLRYENLFGKHIWGKEVQILKICFPLMISNVLPIIITAIPRVLINQNCGQTELGYFSSIFTPTVLITTLVPTVVLSIIPRMSELLQHGDKKNFQKICGMLYIGTTACGVIAVVVSLFIGKPVLALLFGQEILPYYPLFYVAIVATVLNAFVSCGNAVLLVMGNRKSIIGAAFAGLVIIAIISNFLISQYSVYGAAYALILSYSVEVLWQFKGMLFPHRKAKE